MHPSLESIKNYVPKSLQTRLQTVKAPPSSFGEDGVDHINISLTGATRLGQLLSFSSNVRLEHPYFGHFSTMNGFWGYLTSPTRDERFRKLSGGMCRKLSKELPRLKLRNIKYLLKTAEWMRINGNKELVELIKDNTLPFISYYSDGDKGSAVRQPVYHADWYVPFINEVAFSIQFNDIPKSFHGQNDDVQYKMADEAARRYYKEQRLADAEMISEALISMSDTAAEGTVVVKDTCVGDGSSEPLPQVLDSVEADSSEVLHESDD